MVHTEITECVRDCQPISYSLRFKVIMNSWDILESMDYMSNIFKGCIKNYKWDPMSSYDINDDYFIILPLIICSCLLRVSLRVALDQRYM